MKNLSKLFFGMVLGVCTGLCLTLNMWGNEWYKIAIAIIVGITVGTLINEPLLVITLLAKAFKKAGIVKKLKINLPKIRMVKMKINPPNLDWIKKINFTHLIWLFKKIGIGVGKVFLFIFIGIFWKLTKLIGIGVNKVSLFILIEILWIHFPLFLLLSLGFPLALFLPITQPFWTCMALYCGLLLIFFVVSIVYLASRFPKKTGSERAYLNHIFDSMDEKIPLAKTIVKKRGLKTGEEMDQSELYYVFWWVTVTATILSFFALLIEIIRIILSGLIYVLQITLTIPLVALYLFKELRKYGFRIILAFSITMGILLGTYYKSYLVGIITGTIFILIPIGVGYLKKINIGLFFNKFNIALLLWKTIDPIYKNKISAKTV